MSKLYEEITSSLHSNTTYMDYSECEEAAKSIEKLCIQAQIERLEEARKRMLYVIDIRHIDSIIYDLQKQLES